jgi:mannose-6-phosphate isomerase-like protein (cupin superfamily)
MVTTNEIQPGQPIDLTREVVGIDRTTRQAALVEQVPGRPPQRIDGLTIGAPQVTRDAPHDGEVHPDGDEVLYVISGAMSVRLELSDGHRHVDMTAGDALVVPQGVWHKVTMREPGQLLHITPGPNGDARVISQSEVQP